MGMHLRVKECFINFNLKFSVDLKIIKYLQRDFMKCEYI